MSLGDPRNGLNICSICSGGIDHHKKADGTVFWTEGHNAWPINEGRCCTDCNETIVLEARMRSMGMIH